MLLIPSARNLILANEEDGDVSISFMTRTRDLWRCTNMGDKRRDIRVGDMWQDYHEGWDTDTIGQPDICQNLSWDITKQIPSLLSKSERLHGVCPLYGWCISNRDWLNLLLRAIMDWLLVSCNKQRYRGDRCGLVTIKIQKLYWSHYSQNTSALARQRLLTGDDVI